MRSKRTKKFWLVSSHHWLSIEINQPRSLSLKHCWRGVVFCCFFQVQYILTKRYSSSIACIQSPVWNRMCCLRFVTRLRKKLFWSQLTFSLNVLTYMSFEVFILCAGINHKIICDRAHHLQILLCLISDPKLCVFTVRRKERRKTYLKWGTEDPLDRLHQDGWKEPSSILSASPGSFSSSTPATFGYRLDYISSSLTNDLINRVPS